MSNAKSAFSILFVGNHLSQVTGVQSVSESMAANLAREGFRTWLTSQKPGQLERLLDMCLTIWSRRRQYDLALVEVFSGKAFIWAEVTCFLLDLINKPYILALHGGNLPSFAQRYPKRVRRLLNHAKRVCVPSRYLLEAMRGFRSDLRLIPNPIELSRYPFRLRTVLKPKITWLRSFHAIYNPLLVPEVMQRLLEHFPDAHITMFGPDKGDGSLQAMRALADQIGVSKTITTPGAVPKGDVPHRLTEFDIFLNTTDIDNAPVSVLEAMACGLCVVSTNVGGLPYLLDHASDSLLVNPSDAQAMAEAVERLLTDPALASLLSHNARQKAEQYDWAFILPMWLDVFQDAQESANNVAR